MRPRWVVLNLETGKVEAHRSELKALRVAARNGVPSAGEAAALLVLARVLGFLAVVLVLAAAAFAVLA